jgi:protein-tyrosine phosphatase
MVDIHAHFLPGLDDGPTTTEQATEMLEAAAAAGTTDIVATPHANTVWSFDAAATRRLVDELQERMGDRIRLSYGCEVHVTVGNVEDAVRHPSKYAINGKRYVLAEASNFAAPAALAPIFAALRGAGLRPILAHPERNALVQRRMQLLEPLIADGVLMQVTALAVRGPLVRKMIEAGWVFCVASDAHDPEVRTPAEMAEAYGEVRGRFGVETAERLFRTNPAKAVSGD